MRESRASSRQGFSIVELMIVVTIIGILAILAIPAVRRARTRSQNASFVNDLRVLSGQVFEYYALNHGDFPPDVGPGVEPSGAGQYMPKRFEWSEPTDIGGLWDWDRAATRGDKLHGCYAGISVYKPERTTAEMQTIDGMMDDGNLLTGSFRRRTDGYIYVLQF
jgi:type IV pilus assembly protein PilA